MYGMTNGTSEKVFCGIFGIRSHYENNLIKMEGTNVGNLYDYKIANFRNLYNLKLI